MCSKKVCKGCSEEKELSEFYKDSRSKDSFTSRCKKCIKDNRLSQLNYLASIGVKRCSICKNEKNLNAFYSGRSECIFCGNIKRNEKLRNDICGIYKITSPSGRVYIGESKNIYDRWKDYNNLNNCKKQRKLFQSFKKYGVVNHTFEIIEECLFEDLLCKERYWQDYYDVLNGGLNCILTECGKLKSKVSSETRNKIGKASIGRKPTEENIQKMSIRMSGENNPMYGLKGKNHPAYGRIRSKEEIDSMNRNRIVKKGKDNPCYCGNNYNSQLVLDTQTGVYYYCVSELAHLYNYKYTTLYNQLKGHKRNKTSFILV